MSDNSNRQTRSRTSATSDRSPSASSVNGQTVKENNSGEDKELTQRDLKRPKRSHSIQKEKKEASTTAKKSQKQSYSKTTQVKKTKKSAGSGQTKSQIVEECNKQNAIDEEDLEEIEDEDEEDDFILDDEKQSKKNKNKHDEEDDEDEDEDDDDDEEDGDYEITVEDFQQQLKDKLLNLKWSVDTLKKIEIDEIDEPMEIEGDVEGFDIQKVLLNKTKKAYLLKLLSSQPPYEYCKTPKEKLEFFQGLNDKFKKDLSLEKQRELDPSHTRKVLFAFDKAETVEFDLNEIVKEISSLPVKQGVEVKSDE